MCFVSVRSDGVNRRNAGWYRLNMTVPQVWGDQPQINLLTRATPSDKIYEGAQISSRVLAYKKKTLQYQWGLIAHIGTVDHTGRHTTGV